MDSNQNVGAKSTDNTTSSGTDWGTISEHSVASQDSFETAYINSAPVTAGSRFEDSSSTSELRCTQSFPGIQDCNLNELTEINESNISKLESLLTVEDTSKTSKKDGLEISPNILACGGSTPLKKIYRIPAHFSIKCQIFAKCEYSGRTGSIKNHVAEYLIKEAEANKILSPGLNKDTLVVPYSSTLAISLAQIGAVKGYYVVALLPDYCPETQIDILHGLGGEIIRANATDIPRLVQEMIAEIPNCHLFSEYTDANKIPDFYMKPAQEILDNVRGPISVIVCSPESSGLGQAIKKQSDDSLLVGSHCIKTPESDELDHFYNAMELVYHISESEVFKMSRNLMSCEALMVPPSGGAAMCAALMSIQQYGLGENPEANVVVILGESFQLFQTDILDDSWMLENRIYDIPEMMGRHWWYDMTVGRLELRVPNQIEKTLSVRFALDVMMAEGSQELIVVDEVDNNIIIGITTRDFLIKRLARNKLVEADTLEHPAAISADFHRLDINATLGDVAKEMKSSFYFIVMMKHYFLGTENSNENAEHKDIIVGFFTSLDVLKYTCGLEEHHKLNLKTDLNQPFISFDPTTALANS